MMSKALSKIVRLKLGTKTPKYNSTKAQIDQFGKDTVQLSGPIRQNSKDISISEETGETPPPELFFDLPRKRSRKDSDYSDSKSSDMSSCESKKE